MGPDPPSGTTGAKPTWSSLRALARSLVPRSAVPRRIDTQARRWSALVLAGGLASGATFGALALRHSAPSRPAHLTTIIASGSAGFKTTPSGELQRWGDAEITVYVDKSVDQLGAGAHEAVERGFGTWLASTANLPALRFDTTHGARPSLEPDGKSTILVAEIPFSGHRHDLAITIGFLDPVTSKLVEADIVLNARYDWAVLEAAPPNNTDGTDDHGKHAENSGLSCSGSSADTNCGGRYDVEDIATHEIGHFFGLGEDNDDPRATMFRCSSVCELHKRDLASDDHLAMRTLYIDAGHAPQAQAASCDVARTSPPTGSAAWGWICLGVAAGVAVRRRARA